MFVSTGNLCYANIITTGTGAKSGYSGADASGGASYGGPGPQCGGSYGCSWTSLVPPLSALVKVVVVHVTVCKETTQFDAGFTILINECNIQGKLMNCLEMLCNSSRGTRVD